MRDQRPALALLGAWTVVVAATLAFSTVLLAVEATAGYQAAALWFRIALTALFGGWVMSKVRP